MDERHPGQIFLKNLTALKSSHNSVQCRNLNVYIDQAPEIKFIFTSRAYLQWALKCYIAHGNSAQTQTTY